MRVLNISLLTVMLLLLSSIAPAKADVQDSAFFEIKDIGCHMYNGECFVIFDDGKNGEPSFSSSDAYGSCSGAQPRWNSLKTVNGRAMLSMLMSAWVARKLVSLGIEGCYRDNPSGVSPTFSWIHLRDRKFVP